MTGKLNEMISKMKTATSPPPKKNAKKIAQTTVAQKGKRGNTLAQKRGAPQTAPKKKAAAPAPAPAPAAGKKAKKAAAAKPAAGVKGKTPPKKAAPKKKVNVKKTGKGKPTAPADKPKGPADPKALDMEMDTYWFKAGKGPNPELVKLDSDMDAYFQNKPTKEAEAAEAAPAPAPEAAEPAKE